MSDILTITRLHCGERQGAWHCLPGTCVEAQNSDYAFLWLRQGKATCRLRAKTCTVSAGDIMLLMPNEPMQWRFGAAGPSVLYGFRFDVSSIPPSWPAPEDWPLKRHMPMDDVVRPLFEYVLQHAADCIDEVPPPLLSAIQMMLATFILGPVGRSHEDPAHPFPTAVLRVLQWMEEFMYLTPNLKVTLGDLAVIGGVCTTHLCRVFHQQFGIGPLELLYQLRIGKSLIGLREGKKIEALAHDLGFANAAHYTRRFKKMLGKSPSAMRKAMAKGYRPKMPRLPLMR